MTNKCSEYCIDGEDCMLCHPKLRAIQTHSDKDTVEVPSDD